jgi:hypothetical protein
LPAASLSAFTTTRRDPSDSTYFRASILLLNVRASAVGMPWRSIRSLENAFEDSIRAAD